MKRNIIAITVSNRYESKNKYVAEIEESSTYLDELQGVIHLSCTYTMNELNEILTNLKKQTITTVLLDVENIPKHMIDELKVHIGRKGFNMIEINHKVIFNQDNAFCILLNEKYIDLEILTRKILHDNVKELYVLLEEETYYQNRYLHKLQAMTDILNINLHIFLSIDKDELGGEYRDEEYQCSIMGNIHINN